MSDVKRYWFPQDEFKTDIPYVESPDYAKLEAEAQALREEVAALRARVVVDEHAEFERLFSIYKMKRHNHGTGGYTDFMTHCVFEAFQAGVRLNGKAVSEGLLRRLLQTCRFTMSSADYEELRALLGEGKEHE